MASAIDWYGRVRRAGAVPAVLFVDDWDLDSFFQLAAGLRRAGLRAIRVTTGPTGRVGSALCWDRTVVLSSVSELCNLASILSDEDIIDIHTVESLARQTRAGLGDDGATHDGNSWGERSKYANKSTTAARLRVAGIQVPEAISMATVTPSEAVLRLGLPLVVKPVMGSGGQGVQIVQTEDELENLVGNSAPLENWCYEKFVAGQPLRFGALVTELGIERSAAYATMDPVTHLGAATEVSYLDDPQVVETGHQVAAALGLVGLFNVDMIRDSDGIDWVHDVNPRVWGSFAAFQPIGVDFVEPYVRWLLHQPRADAPDPAAATHPLWVFPAGWEDVAAGGPRSLAPIRIARWAWPFLHKFGARYIAYVFWKRCRTALAERSHRREGGSLRW